MFFALPSISNLGGYLAKHPRDWPFSLRLALICIPAILLCCLAFSLAGYYTAANAYTRSLHMAPSMEAKMLEKEMEKALSDIRDSLFALAASGNITPALLQENIQGTFHKHIEILSEIGLRKNKEDGFILFRDTGKFYEIPLREAPQGPYSLFQQITSLPLRKGEITLYPAVTVYYPATPEKDRLLPVTVLRMALPLSDDSGILVVGINMQALRDRLSGQMRETLAHLEKNEGKSFSFAYFFDADGWILFEMQQKSALHALSADFARRGFTGDLGRPGFDEAFRPWAVYENFWLMVTTVRNNESGMVETSAKYYSSEHSRSSAAMYYTPVLFASQEGGPPSVIGGIAFMQTFSLPQAVFWHFVWIICLLSGCAFFLWLFIFRRLHYSFGSPLSRIALETKSMLSSKEFRTLEQRPVFREHQMLLAAANGFISHAMSVQSNLDRMAGEVHNARSRQPVDLAMAISLPHHKMQWDYGMVGSSALVCDVREEIKKATKAGTDVLICGETGTGKELVAEAIHNSSNRKNGPLISVNCGALDENLLLDMLFGHTKGAFTEAHTERKGAFLTAEGGTLHLDEIGNASLKVQQALLRALSVRRIRPLGTDAEIPFDTRVIAATNVDLLENVKTGGFREDLYYRLAIITIRTPSLRDRKEDIPELAAFFIQECGLKMQKPNIQLSRGALDVLLRHDWPGNVRELKNCIVRAIAFAEGDLILPQHIRYTNGQNEGSLSSSVRTPQPLTGKTPTPVNPESPLEPPFPEGLNERQALAWPAIARQKKITRSEYQHIVGRDISSRTAQHDLSGLVKMGLVHRLGAGPGTCYVLAKE